MKRQLEIMVLLVLAFVLVFILVGSTAAKEKEVDSKLYEVLKRGKVKVGVTSIVPPVGFIDQNNQLVGFEIDLAYLLAETLFKDKSKVELVTLDFAARWAALDTEKVDCLIMTTTIYPKRLAKVAFTRPYVDSGIALIVRKDSPIKHLSDLNDENYTIAQMNNPASLERHEKYIPKAKMIFGAGSAEIFLALKSGRADAATVELMNAQWRLSREKNYRLLPELLGAVNHNAIVLKQGDFTWWHYLDSFVMELTSGSLYKEYSAVYKKWLGVDAPPSRYYGISR
ncbi:MAG: transporter substrate-binding domain-containing protein [Deltaproteobacteria bacterium]|nr:transporter substrate-binding domain-containing protein [Deltaproteobacteria bacterium]